ncbi:PKD domain-containing protein [Maribellus sediminis]|uniref:PKD domain-containing protein n=1 Tax=Maribellus sediminis TaxID=2696285 RepID=UPI00142F81CC|nr:PKD domain-containing protein [Maribellus sediminis]
MRQLLLFIIFLGLINAELKAQTEKLIGGNLQDSTNWQISYLNTAEGAEPTAVWNYTVDQPTAGVDGNLYVTGTTNSGNSQYCIYQEVELSSDKVYTFDGAYKAVQINNSWCEVFIGSQPTDGSDYGDGQTRLAAFGTWAGYNKDDGVFSQDIDQANYNTFTPSSSGTYYLVVKMGSTSWDNSEQTFEVMLDELSLTESDPVKLSAGGSIMGGNMEDASKWNISLLNTAEGAEPTAEWNSTTDVPNAGIGGNLHVSGTTNAGNSQYCIYQSVTLSADSSYSFDGAFKAVQINNSWCEVFIGTEPTEGNDYGDGQFRLAAFGTWAGYSKADGIFSEDIDAGNYNVFVPDSSGEYFFVLKMGSTSWDGSDQAFEIIVDELSLTAARTNPIPDFTANVVNGIAPLEVTFTNKSKMATSWSWNFGDGSAESTEESPAHTFTEAGKYTVTLTAINEVGDSIITKTDYITINPPVEVVAGGVLSGGNMEDETKWQTTFLSTPSGSEPLVSWNDTEHTPTAGDGGCLFVTGLSNNSTVQYAIYQKVTLSADSVYTFNAAVKDFTSNLNQAWYEAFIGSEPIDGVDYSKDDADKFLLADFSTWSTECNPKGIDGTFAANACTNNSFIPDSTGEYYFVIKFGSTSWASDDMPFALALDELSLTAKRTKPMTAFAVDNPLGFAPLTVQFTDKSKFASSWSWNFGDGSEVSTEQNPQHTFENVGTYTVTLTATNEKGDSVLVKTDLVKANAKPELPEGEKLYGGNMEDPNLWNITTLNASAIPTATWNYREDTLAAGEGGNLMISATALNTTSNYCIWQPVELVAGKKYTFTAAFRDISENLDHFWSEVMIGTSAPVDGSDYAKDAEGTTLIAFFNTWDCGAAKGLNGTYQDNACGDEPVGVFVPETSGTYYFVIKTGNNDWENTEYKFKVLIDEVSLKEAENVPAPVADFFADVTEGDNPLSVYFTDLSENAVSWSWDFGDGNTSTEQSPEYTYTTAGTFTVTLIAYNSANDADTLKVENLITVTSTTAIEEIGDGGLSVYPNPSHGKIYVSMDGIQEKSVSVFDLTGKLVEAKTSSHDNVVEINLENRGIYFIKVSQDDWVRVSKVVIR